MLWLFLAILGVLGYRHRTCTAEVKNEGWTGKKTEEKKKREPRTKRQQQLLAASTIPHMGPLMVLATEIWSLPLVDDFRYVHFSKMEGDDTFGKYLLGDWSHQTVLFPEAVPFGQLQTRWGTAKCLPSIASHGWQWEIVVLVGQESVNWSVLQLWDLLVDNHYKSL